MQKNNFIFLTYLAGLSVLGYLATDMYLPAFEAMQEQLAVTPQYISATLSVFLGGYAIAQLLWGDISDRYGKKTALVSGIGIFTISSFLIYFTNSINYILFLRLIQAMGVCSAAVSWQTLVVDNYSKEQAKKVFSTIMPLVALSPALAPLIGVLILKYLGWKFIFLFLAVISGILLLTTFTLQEKVKIHIRQNISYIQLLTKPVYMGNVIIYAACSAAFFAWLTGSPFILKQLGHTPEEIGLSYIPQTITFLIGGYGYRFIVGKISNQYLLPRILICFSLCMLSVFFITIYSKPTLFVLLIPFCFMALFNGACYPIVVAEALTPFTGNSGKASALQNSIQLGICFIASAIVSFFSKIPLIATASVMLSTIVLVWIGYWLIQRKK